MKKKIFSLLVLVMTVMTASAIDAPKYSLEKAEGAEVHGKIAFTVNSNTVTAAAESDVVTVTITPDEGWFIDKVEGQWCAAVAASRGAIAMLNDIELTPVQGTSNQWTFTMQRATAEISVKYELIAVKLIKGIGKVEYTLLCKSKIDEAREVYDDLSPEQKGFVSTETLKILTDAEAAYEKMRIDHDAAELAMAKINAIGEVAYTRESKDLIDFAREAYDGLTDDQKVLVREEVLKILTDAEAAYEALKKAKEEADAAAAKAAADKEAADAAAAKINAIGEVELTDDSKALIDDAREAYDALTDDQKGLIAEETLKVLTDAEAAYEALKKAKEEADAAEQAAAEKAAADKAAADAAAAKIDAIGKVELTDDSKALIDDAREAYDGLTDDQKALVDEETLKVLTDAEAAYEALVKAKEDADAAEQAAAEKAAADKAAADAAAAKIDAIGEVVLTDESKALIDDAREAYDALTDDQKALVDEETLKVLTGAEAAYEALKKAKEYEDAAAAEKAAADKAAADAVIAKINAIGDAGQDQEFYLKVAAARGAYDALTADQKALVGAETLKVLTDAEAVVTGLSGELRTENGEAAAAAWYTLDVIMGTGCLKGNPFHGFIQEPVPSVFPTVISSDEPF